MQKMIHQDRTTKKKKRIIKYENNLNFEITLDTDLTYS
jgi:hypothetical protein